MKFPHLPLLALLFTGLSGMSLAQSALEPHTHFSVETDPAFWISTLPNGPGFDANFDFRPKSAPRLRVGVLGYAGTWEGEFARNLLLNKDFGNLDWRVQWNGLGVEMQHQFRLGLKRGGVQPGLRMQWNQFSYSLAGTQAGTANHLVLTPQVGFQWFPFPKMGLYVLPWAGVQLPVAGTRSLELAGELRNTRKPLQVVTAHVGWEF